MPIGKRMKERRSELGLTLQEVSDRTNVSGSTIFRYENGEIKNIPSGQPKLAIEDVEGYMPTMAKNPNEYFYLRVNGESMINAGIKNGSLVLIHLQQCAENGDIIACRVNGDEATLKRYKEISEDSVLLLPENEKFEPILIRKEDFESGHASIIGIAKQVITEL